MDGVRQQRFGIFFGFPIFFLMYVRMCIFFVYPTLCLRIRISSSAFCRKAMKWRSGGFRGHPALILLPVRTFPTLTAPLPRLPRASAADECTLEGKFTSRKNISQLTTGRPIHPHPHSPSTPHCDITFRLHLKHCQEQRERMQAF